MRKVLYYYLLNWEDRSGRLEYFMITTIFFATWLLGNEVKLVDSPKLELIIFLAYFLPLWAMFNSVLMRRFKDIGINNPFGMLIFLSHMMIMLGITLLGFFDVIKIPYLAIVIPLVLPYILIGIKPSRESKDLGR